MSFINVIDIETDNFEGDILSVSICEVDTKTMNGSRYKTFSIDDYNDISGLFSHMKDEYKIDTRKWLSWSPYDHRMIKETCDKLSIEYPLHEQFIDIHDLFRKYIIRNNYTQDTASFLTSAQSFFNIYGNDIESIISIFKQLLSITAYNTIYDSIFYS